MMNWKKGMSLCMVLLLLLSAVACGSKDNTDNNTTGNGMDTGTESEDTGTTDGNDTSDLPAIYDVTLGEDYTDLTADIKILTHRTDVVDTLFADYVSSFNEVYPNITINYEAITDYAQDMTMRLTTDDWGDICMIPTTVDKDELPNLFTSYGDLTEMNKIYNFNNNFSYDGDVYGVASTGNVQGIVYNKAVFEEAGIDALPTTPDAFLDDLQKIKDNTDAIPMYSNFAAGWTMGAWDAYIGGGATGNADYMTREILHTKNPFADRGDMTGPYAVYYTLYEATARGLIEDDPTTTDWEGSKTMMNNGDIGVMVLGTWAVPQMQEAGPNPDDIAYMPFPITVDGKQYASAGPDYNFGINNKISDDEKIASMLYVKWLTEESHYAYDQGGIPVDKTEDLPATLSAFDGVELVVDNPALPGEETLFNDLNNESELGLNADNYPDSAILEAALTGSQTLDDIMAEWNEKWTRAQEKYDVEVVE